MNLFLMYAGVFISIFGLIGAIWWYLSYNDRKHREELKREEDEAIARFNARQRYFATHYDEDPKPSSDLPPRKPAKLVSIAGRPVTIVPVPEKKQDEDDDPIDLTAVLLTAAATYPGAARAERTERTEDPAPFEPKGGEFGGAGAEGPSKQSADTDKA